MIISAGCMAIKGSHKNIFERPSCMCKIRQINRLVKFYFVTHILESLVGLLRTNLKVIFYVLFERESVLIVIIEVVLRILKFVRYHAMYFMFYSI